MIDDKTAMWFIAGLFGAFFAAVALLIGHIKVVNWVSDDCDRRKKKEWYQYLAIARMK
ncbi:hypothetical protein [Cohnella sp. GCM10012308]|uniref:hypothetical protein n=1 Tax=Cohnella sp. GCM10012308 TaxID=3317329 RepID=UPI00361CCEB8